VGSLFLRYLIGILVMMTGEVQLFATDYALYYITVHFISELINFPFGNLY